MRLVKILQLKIFERTNNEYFIRKIIGQKSNKNKFEIYAEDMKNQSSQLFLSRNSEVNS